MRITSNLFLRLLTILALSIPSYLLAGNLTSLDIKAGLGKRVSVVLDNMGTRSTVRLGLRDENGNILLTKNIAGEKRFAKVFNLDNLPNGKYELVFDTGLKEVIQPFKIRNDQVQLNAYERKEYFAPVFKVKNGVVMLSYLNKRVSNVSVEIMDEYGESIFQEKHSYVLQVQRQYDLNNVSGKMCTVKVVTPVKTYYENIRLK